MCFADWSRPDLLTLFNVIGTILTAGFTLGLIIVANKGFKKLLSQEAGKAQLNLMLKLMDELAAERIEITEMDSKINYLPKIIFSKSILEYTNHDLKIFSNTDFLITENGFTSVAFTYLHKALLPNSIVSAIKGIRDLPILYYTVTRETLPKKFYYIPGGMPVERIIQQPMTRIYEGLPAYLKACLHLKKVIREWFSEHGVSDLNSDFLSP